MQRAAYNLLWRQDRRSQIRMEGLYVDEVWGRYFHAEADLNIHGPPEIRRVTNDVRAMFERWVSEDFDESDWLQLREKLLSAYQSANDLATAAIE